MESESSENQRKLVRWCRFRPVVSEWSVGNGVGFLSVQIRSACGFTPGLRDQSGIDRAQPPQHVGGLDVQVRLSRMRFDGQVADLRQVRPPLVETMRIDVVGVV